jgi:hypothetical protein
VAAYEVRVQLGTDLESMLGKDAAINWPLDQSSYQVVGKLVLPAQDAFCPARRVFADDVLTFNPFHLPARAPAPR